ncbi:arylsulfatase F isoform X1 [Suricata suricatta]|uniref:Arylsulfatase F n=1 Tax=Suricata suricatta TaxID=37032 RepID=A0A673VR71_SURSU|nr:arylsulfatase F isoform X1 [Suricata suricatta]XP_029786600.1 arylsulfatase F isoform X1 [Suricata suricatta]XP_029786601.1 arylsulfatase F isoform X1 [Suricata suricatta]XP_029786602.1 arylsulfatase F isoform X1 [Suricata suricatta]XP_029786603.1 arylsulfatase F isoform X1 [Suricata suricatta]XP_029786605.1 arylsulfatase F isoform X1 [Suricata suricatta]XP_029786606.1 arylsulfatase F isoform X1 [Suricata suricatta]XP_029786607.1 arylsulfatase F isoform X1 [Suricata suricatta]XP_02978660
MQDVLQTTFSSRPGPHRVAVTQGSTFFLWPKKIRSQSPLYIMKFRSLLIALSWTCLLLSPCGARDVREDKPNIVVIIVDDLGIGDLGCFGNDTMRTPNIDRLAREGVQLNHHISAAAMCTPSRAALLTGRYPIRSGMVSDGGSRVVATLGSPAGLPLNETTFAALLKGQGYSTALIGKWHQGLNCDSRQDHCHHPYNYGFDYFYGMPFTLFEPCWPDPSRDTELAIASKVWLCVQLVAIAVLTAILGKLSRMIRLPWSFIFFMVLLIFLLGYFWFSSYQSRLYWDCLLMREHEITEQPMNGERAGSIMLKEAISFMERCREGPFLLLFSFLHVHMPLPTTTDFIGTSRHGLYGDNVEEMDSMVGKLLDAIDSFGVRNHTLVYFTSDHGGHLEARVGHAQLGGWNGIFKGGKGMGGWEGGIRVPGLVRWPGRLPAGKVVDEPTSLMDVFPTLAAVSGSRVPQDRVIDGQDLMPLLQGDVERSEHEFLFHYCGAFLHAARWHPKDSEAVWKVHYVTPVFQPPGAQACYETKYCQCSGKLVTYHDPPLLFDLTRDPSESTPLTPDAEPWYNAVIQTVASAVKEHERSIVPVQHQLSALNRDNTWLKPCCGLFPFCVCDKEGNTSAPGA